MSNPHGSPSIQFSVSENFSAEEIRELLGACISDEHEEVDTSNAEHSQTMPQPDSNIGEIAPISSVHRDSSSREITDGHSLADNVESSDSVIVSDEARAQARSERKRCREKQRRLDVNKQFSDLTSLISLIEQEEKEEDSSIIRLGYSASNRADLIARAIAHLERLRDSNKRRRTEIINLQQQVAETKKAGEDVAARLKEALCSNRQMMVMPQPNKQVMMMVPMMMPTGAAQNYGMMQSQMGNFMMPQPFGQPIQPQQQQQQQPGMQMQQEQVSQQMQMQQQQQLPQQTQMFGMQNFVPTVTNTTMQSMPSSQNVPTIQGTQTQQGPSFDAQTTNQSFVPAPLTMAPIQPDGVSESGAPISNGATTDINGRTEQKLQSEMDGAYAHCA